MENPLIRKLENFTKLSQSDKDAIAEMATVRVRHAVAREDLVREGDRPEALFLILDGWAYRYKYLENGQRQIMSFFIAGDLCDLNIFVLREMDHSIATVTDVDVAVISRDAFNELSLECPRVIQALLWESLVNSAIQREWTVNLGQRDAMERVSHLLCELFVRLQAVGLTSGDSCAFPITQAELADATGLSTVHMNRTIQELRSDGLIGLKGRTLIIPDLEALQRRGMFSPNYLHLGREGSHLDANE
ncbi:MAG: Crp/Fnr family transcriptional regulator [Pararhizobium sp.]